MYDNIYVTPGISLFDKKLKHAPVLKLKRDLDLYYRSLKNEKIIAVTGTNGKSTTTKLIGEIIKKKYNNTFIGGNIGEALCNSFTKKAKCLHWTGSRKPWGKRGRYRELYLKYCL